MKRRHTVFALLFILATAVLVGCSLGGDSQSEADEATPIPPVIETSSIVSAEAFVVPIREVDMAFESSGRVVEILVQEGERVEAGQILARLNDADAAAAVAAAEAALAQAQANLKSVVAGPTAEQIAIAQAAVQRAEANLANIKAGPTQEQLAIAEAALARAETNLAQVVNGPTPEEIAIAQARVDTLQAQLNNVLSGTRIERLKASAAQLRQAEADLSLAQAEYDKIAYAADSEFAQPIAIQLQKATLVYEAALANHEALLNGATPQEAAITRAQLAEGQAALKQVLAGATAEQIALAQISVMEAEANLTQVLAGARPEQIAIAEAGVAEAQANLEQVLAGATPEQIAVAEANVRQAEAALEQARLAIDKTQLKAPFAGIVTSLDLEVGQLVAAGVPAVNVADLSRWQIETDDLTEIDVVKVAAGQPVTIRFDALSEESFSGVVRRIKPRSEIKAGDVTYTVLIDLDDGSDPRLRWGMTTFVEINAE